MKVLDLRLACTDASSCVDLFRFLKALCDERRLTLGKLAKLAGVDATNVKRTFESSNPRPRLRLVTKIAEVLGVSLVVTSRYDPHGDVGKRKGCENMNGDKQTHDVVAHAVDEATALVATIASAGVTPATKKALELHAKLFRSMVLLDTPQVAWLDASSDSITSCLRFTELAAETAIASGNSDILRDSLRHLSVLLEAIRLFAPGAVTRLLEADRKAERAITEAIGSALEQYVIARTNLEAETPPADAIQPERTNCEAANTDEPDENEAATSEGSDEAELNCEAETPPAEAVEEVPELERAEFERLRQANADEPDNNEAASSEGSDEAELEIYEVGEVYEDRVTLGRMICKRRSRALLASIEPRQVMCHEGYGVYHSTDEDLEFFIGMRGAGAATAREIARALRKIDVQMIHGTVEEVRDGFAQVHEWLGRRTLETFAAALGKLRCSLAVWAFQDGSWTIFPRWIDYVHEVFVEEPDRESLIAWKRRLFEELVDMPASPDGHAASPDGALGAGDP